MKDGLTITDLNEINIPKQVITYEEHDGYQEGEWLVRTSFGCPVCRNTVIPYAERCEACGQVLEWRGV